MARGTVPCPGDLPGVKEGITKEPGGAGRVLEVLMGGPRTGHGILDHLACALLLLGDSEMGQRSMDSAQEWIRSH